MLWMLCPAEYARSGHAFPNRARHHCARPAILLAAIRCENVSLVRRQRIVMRAIVQSDAGVLDPENVCGRLLLASPKINLSYFCFWPRHVTRREPAVWLRPPVSSSVYNEALLRPLTLCFIESRDD